MDPTETLRTMLKKLRELGHDRREETLADYHEAASHLWEWLARGGFAPNVDDVTGAAAALHGLRLLEQIAARSRDADSRVLAAGAAQDMRAQLPASVLSE